MLAAQKEKFRQMLLGTAARLYDAELNFGVGASGQSKKVAVMKQ